MKKKSFLTIFASGLIAAMLMFTGCTGNNGDSGKTDKINSLDDLNDKKIGVQQGTTGSIYAEDEYGTSNVEQFNKGADAIIALTQGKVDAVIIDNQPAKIFVEKNDGLKILDEAFADEDYAMCISKDNSELTKEFNEAIAQLKSDGTLQNLMDYYIEGKEGSTPYTSPENVDYSKGKLKMATNAAFPPYEYWENNEISGLDADFAKAICDVLGYELEIEDMDFDAIIISVQSGKADFGAAGMTVTEERLKNIDFTESYCKGVQSVIVKE